MPGPGPGPGEVQDQGQRADRPGADRGACHGVGEVVPPQRHDRHDHDGDRRAADGDHQQPRRPGPGPLGRDEQQHREHRCQRDDRRCVPAREGQRAEIGPVDDVLEQAVVQRGGDRHGGQRQHGAAEPAVEQAPGRGGDADHDGRNERAGKGHPQQQVPVAGEKRDEGRVDGVVEPVGPRLAGEHRAEHADHDHAPREKHGGRPTTVRPEQQPAPRYPHVPLLRSHESLTRAPELGGEPWRSVTPDANDPDISGRAARAARRGQAAEGTFPAVRAFRHPGHRRGPGTGARDPRD